MADHCPHCGVKLPWVVDAFCSSCGKELDEPPELPPAGAHPGAARERVTHSPIGLILIVAGLMTMFPAYLSLTRGAWIEGLLDGSVGVVFVAIGAFLQRRANRSGG